ncbi:NAD(P)-dependent oxidoreductase [Chelativorans salis]|uniref:NAD(P)-dependent oxidoreductase n=1 Tax=Chelativorans salis TaxID=2978478 RepID=A0ABT2LJ40_9HYPH|nr:NAD(P)-dependent oxidoreductase [Chelativorans sp. EGI FJ00035]MCT7374600.1 NAD(P)-dependent oxidoreductase [Chelativorans sp. EGI FJ00035]
MTEKPAIGWIGLGKLGLPIAGRIAEAGYSVTGYDPASDRLALAAGRGIEGTAAMESAARADVVFSCLPDDRALRAATLGEQGLLALMRKGAVFVEISTVSPEASAEVAKAAEAAGVHYLRVPISGNASIAHTGNLSCFASGPKEVFEEILPMLATFTRAQVHLGPGEEARYAKLAINLMMAATAVMLGESLALARRGKLDWQDMLDVLADSAAASPMVKYKVGPLAERDFTSTFSCKQMIKDLDLIIGAGRAGSVPMPLTALVRETYAAIVARGEGALDFIAPVKHTEWLAGLGEPERRTSRDADG